MKRQHLLFAFVMSVFIMSGCSDSGQEETSSDLNKDIFNEEATQLLMKK
ncbi:hypothetical protein [Gracilibacillus sp. JCM 18860]